MTPASENSELSESASTPCARMTSINSSTYKDMNFESESSQSQERPRKQTRVQRKENEVRYTYHSCYLWKRRRFLNWRHTDPEKSRFLKKCLNYNVEAPLQLNP